MTSLTSSNSHIDHVIILSLQVTGVLFITLTSSISKIIIYCNSKSRAIGRYIITFVLLFLLRLSESSRVVYVESERNVKVELPQNFNIEINPTTINLQTDKFDKIKIMIMSSMPRSGSTLLGELLFNFSRETKYYFEPDQYLEKNLCLENDSCTVTFFNDLLSCKGNKTFHDWYKNKRFFFKYYDSKAKRCNNGTDYKNCVGEIDLNDDCRNSGLMLIKNIRTRLKIVRDVLRENKDLKIIHLIRDPRGSLWSIKRFKWGVSEETRCKDFADDLNAFNKLKKQFPQRIINVSYELFSKEPLKVTENFIKEHLSPEADVNGVMSTFKNATSQYQLWRRKISDDYLKKIENISDCREDFFIILHRDLVKQLNLKCSRRQQSMAVIC
ncbi:hypothetical protein Anas_00587 [Armadillidium nasatum]|uniref:Sulfotransferase domain-containing protein n=1 Tax=Armadillidium nasatum TaxID=96803 RepID=A0A5N5TGI7_9CRUS|nr:hypothetical protein Anas_00587 [Armadillidium nasatum]